MPVALMLRFSAAGRLSDIQRKVPIKGIYHAGSHGLEISGPNMQYVHLKALAARTIIDKVRMSVKKEFANIEGILIEKKKFSFTLHYRMANKTDGAFVRKTFYKIISENTGKQGIAILKGKKVLELAPNVSWDKGQAALMIIRQLEKTCLPIYIGDDVTDETAFNALSESGITIRVGFSNKTAAQYFIRDQREILRFLQYISEMIHTVGHRALAVHGSPSPDMPYSRGQVPGRKTCPALTYRLYCKITSTNSAAT